VPTAQANGIEICFETTGSPDDPALLLIHGYGAQLIQWPDLLLEELAARGFFVIRFDNRDVGRSTKLDGQHPVFGLPEPGQPFPTMAQAPPYTLADMARDATGLLDHLGIQRAHVLGASLGGAVAQRLAIEMPDRVLSLTSVMSATGDPAVPGADPAAAAAVFSPSPTAREDFIEHLVRVLRVLYGPHYDEDDARAQATARFDRCFYPEGMTRQLAALIADGDRTAALQRLTVPTLVIHGRLDPLAPLAAGEATAAAIPGAELVVFDDMGHDLPKAYAAQFATEIAKVAARAR
jgi:pimeloyl-ACP methyl ester carboxylesterase